MILYALCDLLSFLCLALAGPVAVLALPGFLAFARSQDTYSGVASVSFLASISTVSYQIRYFVDVLPTSPQLVLSLTLSLLMLIVSLILLAQTRRITPEVVERVVRNLDHALAIVDLAQLDPDRAAELANQMRAETAKLEISLVN